VFKLFCFVYLSFYFCVCRRHVITVWGSSTALIFYNSILFDGKVNLVGVIGRSNIKIPNGFQKCLERQNKNEGKTGIFTQNRFSTSSILVLGQMTNSKTNYRRYIKCSQVVYIIIFYT